MGVKLHITQEDLPLEFQKYKLLNSQDGISQTVYFLEDKYVVKIFEDTYIESLENELSLLKILKNLKVSQPIDKIFYLKNHPTLIYPKAKGQSLKNALNNHITQIGIFLSKLHNTTKNKTNSNMQLYTRSRLKNLVLKTKNQDFLNVFNNIDISLNDDGIIHGDLFMDNCSFYNDNLESVYDFCEACIGDFTFDLAVVALSWCKNDNDIKVLLKSYKYQNSFNIFKQYVEYARLYYSVTRFLNNIEYKELLA